MRRRPMAPGSRRKAFRQPHHDGKPPVTLKDFSGLYSPECGAHFALYVYRSQRPQEPLPDVFVAEEVGDDRRTARELAHCLRPLVDKLSAQSGRAAKRIDLQDMKQREAASVLGLSLSSRGFSVLERC